jgi:translation initiation factor 3 subunit A
MLATAPPLPCLLSRLLSQLSQVYSTVKVSTLLDLVKPLDDFGPEQVEAYVMGCARRGELRIRVDHATETISFIDEPFAHSDLSAVSGPSSPSPYDNTTVQLSLAEFLRARLSTLATALHNSVRVIDPKPVRSPDEEAARQSTQFAELVATANAAGNSSRS